MNGLKHVTWTQSGTNEGFPAPGCRQRVRSARSGQGWRGGSAWPAALGQGNGASIAAFAITLFRLIWNQKKFFLLIPDQSEKGS